MTKLPDLYELRERFKAWRKEYNLSHGAAERLIKARTGVEITRENLWFFENKAGTGRGISWEYGRALLLTMEASDESRRPS